MLVARQLCLCKNIPYFSVLLGYIWLLGTFVNSSCDINTYQVEKKINLKGLILFLAYSTQYT